MQGKDFICSAVATWHNIHLSPTKAMLSLMPKYNHGERFHPLYSCHKGTIKRFITIENNTGRLKVQPLRSMGIVLLLEAALRGREGNCGFWHFCVGLVHRRWGKPLSDASTAKQSEQFKVLYSLA